MKYKPFEMMVFVAIIAVLFGITLSNATTMLELSLKELCIQSTDIVVARTVLMNSYLQSDQQRIFTDIELEVNDKIKGQFQRQDRVTLTVYGGTVNGITTRVVGAPRFTVGEQSVLFLSSRRPSANSGQTSLVVVGLAQGKFNIFTDSTTGKQKVVREQIGIPSILSHFLRFQPFSQT